MKITIRGYEPLVIPPASPAGKFDEHTSYVARLIKELQKPKYVGFRLPGKILSLEFLKSHLKPSVYYSEPMAGVGLTAQVLGVGFDTLYLNDNSPDCLAALRLNFPKAVITDEDIRATKFECGDLTFLDFNNFTFRKRVEFEALLRYTFNNTSDYVILNDCTPFYFRYGESSFRTYSGMLGVTIHTTVDYFRAIANAWAAWAPGWHLVAVGWFRDTSFQLFARNPAPLSVREFKVEDVPVGMIEWE